MEQEDQNMSATALKTAAAALAAFALGAAPAAASHYAPDLPLSVKPCKLDTSPRYPSCGTARKARAIKQPAPVFTARPCKLDTSPSYPSCGTGPRR